MVPVWPPVPGGSPVIKLHGADDRLVNENVDLLWTVDGSAERTEDGIEIEQSEEESVAATVGKKRLGPCNLNAIRRTWEIR